MSGAVKSEAETGFAGVAVSIELTAAIGAGAGAGFSFVVSDINGKAARLSPRAAFNSLSDSLGVNREIPDALSRAFSDYFLPVFSAFVARSKTFNSKLAPLVP